MPTYISADGLEKLKQEYEDRRTRVRAEIAQKISAAKELGDLSENFEYQEAKEAQGSNEVRLSHLESMIKDAVVVKAQHGGAFITLGSKFIVETNGKERRFELVGSSEADPIKAKISNESPLGMSFIGRTVGEQVDVQVPLGVTKYKILKIE